MPYSAVVSSNQTAYCPNTLLFFSPSFWNFFFIVKFIFSSFTSCFSSLTKFCSCCFRCFLVSGSYLLFQFQPEDDDEESTLFPPPSSPPCTSFYNASTSYFNPSLSFSIFYLSYFHEVISESYLLNHSLLFSHFLIFFLLNLL